MTDTTREVVEPWDGIPKNPKHFGRHWLANGNQAHYRDVIGETILEWAPGSKTWWAVGSMDSYPAKPITPQRAAEMFTYIGPCLTQEEVYALAADNDALRAEVASILAENDALRFTLNNANAAQRQAVERARGEALEEAAVIAALRSVPVPDDVTMDDHYDAGWNSACEVIALAIRARAGAPDA